MTKEQALSWLRDDTQWVKKTGTTTTVSQRTCKTHPQKTEYVPVNNCRVPSQPHI